MVWKENLHYVMVVAGECDKLILAYGPKGKWEDRAQRLLDKLGQANATLHCLSHTSGRLPSAPIDASG